MIIKGKSRSGPKQLARHLLRTDTNERVAVLENKSMHADLFQTFRDWQFLAAGTRGTKGLYHANIDPDARYAMTPEQWQRSVDVLEKELGLDGQPRIVVLHEKFGREHIHVVWQRTDIESMTLRTDSQNYAAHERASMQLEQEFGHEHVPGKHAKRDKTKEMPRSEYNQEELQHAERTGIDPDERREAISALYKSASNGLAFKQALEEEGFVIARGDRRNFVLVDEEGAIFSLTRQISEVKAKDINAFMSDIDREALPTVEQAKALQEESRYKSEPTEEQAQPEPEPKKENRLSTDDLEKFRNTLKAWHDEDTRALLDAQQEERTQTGQSLDQERDEKLIALKALHLAALDRYDREHRIERRGFTGLIATLWDKITPGRAARVAEAREQERNEFISHLDIERKTQTEQIQRSRGIELADLDERHAQKHREHEALFQEDLSRRLRDYQEAQRLLARLEEQRLLKEGHLQDRSKSTDVSEPGPVLSYDERAAIERRISEKHAQEKEKFKTFHAHETKQLRYILSEELKQKLKNFDTLQNAERERFIMERREQRKGIEGFIDARQQRLNPGEAAEKHEIKDQEWHDFFAQQRRDRKDHLVFLRQDRQQHLNALTEIQEQRLRALADEIEKERGRQLREEERFSDAQAPPPPAHTR